MLAKLLHEDGFVGFLLAQLSILLLDGRGTVWVAVDDAPCQHLAPYAGCRVAA